MQCVLSFELVGAIPWVSKRANGIPFIHKPRQPLPRPLGCLFLVSAAGEGGPLRCEKCRAYINSYASYVHNGEKV